MDATTAVCFLVPHTLADGRLTRCRTSPQGLGTMFGER
ncbi:hypothetical protein THTE_3117 [Thermogutta terrifontis]|uniref:Uncharacterized protein n=1 Tax=Thermogutta terrifontis TaxID=1331910 RepID=A0A286RID2_9BACT|nr:hypothetical protein THTE_3117 [Thermogutta terrifontis]